MQTACFYRCVCQSYTTRSLQEDSQRRLKGQENHLSVMGMKQIDGFVDSRAPIYYPKQQQQHVAHGILLPLLISNDLFPFF